MAKKFTCRDIMAPCETVIIRGRYLKYVFQLVLTFFLFKTVSIYYIHFLFLRNNSRRLTRNLILFIVIFNRTFYWKKRYSSSAKSLMNFSTNRLIFLQEGNFSLSHFNSIWKFMGFIILKLPKIQKFKESVKDRFSKSSRRLEIIALKYLNQYNVITKCSDFIQTCFFNNQLGTFCCFSTEIRMSIHFIEIDSWLCTSNGARFMSTTVNSTSTLIGDWQSLQPCAASDSVQLHTVTHERELNVDARIQSFFLRNSTEFQECNAFLGVFFSIAT